ncbi:MAG: hypothetical protein BIFFINMI_02084 [Phycisphaerae bacterium]|nr:hypothetical protein [Phycisphaerae bacterium]
MFYQVVILLLIGGLTAFLAVQGLYSALIMALCAIFSATLAFNYAEPLAHGFIAPSGPSTDFALPLILLIMFGVCMLALRILADRFLPGMVHFPYLVDRAVGGAFGLVASLIIVGILVIGWQLMPFGRSMMGFDRFAADAEGSHPAMQSLWLGPDRFTVGMVNRLSNGALSGSQRFDRTHPDYLRELAGFSRTVLVGSNGRVADDALSPIKIVAPDAETGRMKNVGESLAPGRWITAAEDLPVALHERMPADAEPGKPIVIDGQRFYCVQLSLNSKVFDSDNVLRLTGGQVQLVSKPPANQPDAPADLSLAAWIATDPQNPQRSEPFGVGHAWQLGSPKKQGNAASDKPAAAAMLVGFVFAVPDGYEPSFVRLLTYTRVAVRTLNEDKDHNERIALPAAGQTAVKFEPEGNWPAADWEIVEGSSLPLILRVEKDQADPKTGIPGKRVKLEGPRLVQAKLWGERRQFGFMPGGVDVTAFAEPSGQRVVLIEARARDVSGFRTLLEGLPLSGATVTYDSGKSGPLAGCYMANADGTYWALLYDRGYTPGFFSSDVDLSGLSGAGGIARLGLIVGLPPGDRIFTVTLGAGRSLKVTLP